jgi:integrase
MPRARCPFLPSVKSCRAICRKARSSVWSTRCPISTALVLVGAYAGLRWGEAAGLRRRDIDPLRSRIRVTSTAVQLRGRVTLDNEPKTTRSKRSVPVARSVMRRLEQHLLEVC